MAKSFNQEYDKTIEASLDNGDKIWTIIVEADLNDADYVQQAKVCSDEEFKSSVFAEVVMLNALSGDYLDDHEWADEVLEEYIPKSDMAYAHTIESVTVYKNGRELNINKVDPIIAAEAVRRYLDAYVDEDYQDEVWEDLTEQGIKLSRKRKFED